MGTNLEKKQIAGMKTGDERRIEKIYPKSAGKNLAGKVEQFKIQKTDPRWNRFVKVIF